MKCILFNFRGSNKTASWSACHMARSRDLWSHPSKVLTATKISTNTFQQRLNTVKITSIACSPDRENIYLTVDNIRDSTCQNYEIEQLSSEKLDTPKTMIFCRSVKDYTELYQLFNQKVGSDGYMSDRF